MTVARQAIAIGLAVAVVAAACTPSSTPTTEGSEVTTSAAASQSPGPNVSPPPPPPIIPLLRTHSNEAVGYGQKVMMTSHVLAAGQVSTLELWIDGALVDRHQFDEPATDPTLPWEWTADSVGLHAAIVRAIDDGGRVAASFPNWFRVDPGWDAVTGEPLDGLAPSPMEQPSAGVTTDTATCGATVAISRAPGSVGQAIVGSTLGTGGSRAIDVVGADGGSIVVPMVSTPILVSIHPYDDEDFLDTTTLIIPGAADCASGAWDGDVTFDGSRLVGGEDLDAVYAYARTSGSPWQRFPVSGFVQPDARGFDFGGVLPAVSAGESLEVEVWGWQDGRVMGLGRGGYQAEGSDKNSPLWGDVQPLAPTSALNIVRTITVVDGGYAVEKLLTADVVCASEVFNPDCGSPTPTLRWNSVNLGAEAGLLQVSSSPPPSGVAIDFPDLLWSTMFAMDGQPQRDVAIPLQEINSGAWLSDQTSVTERTTFDDLATVGSELSVVAAPAPPGASPRVSKPILGSRTFAIEPDRLWVRVIPFTNGEPIDGESNVVSFRVEGAAVTVEASVQQAFDALFSVEVAFAQPQQSNESFAHCVRVIENPFGKENPVPAGSVWDIGFNGQLQFDAFRDSATVYAPGGNTKAGLLPGATVCAYKPDPPDKDLFDYVAEGISFIGQAWDTFKGLVDMVKNGIVKGIVDITGCTPKDVCIGALQVLGDIGLASLGVPPSLPSFSELAEAAEGDLASALAKELVGQACGSVPCDEFAKKFIEDAFDDIEEHFSDLAVAQATSGGWVLRLHPDIRVVPEPAGQLFPGSAHVTITRKAGGAVPGSTSVRSCAVSLRTDGAGPLNWTEKGGTHHENEPVSGTVFAAESVGVDLSRLEPGESVTVGVASLEFESISYLKGTSPFVAGYVSQERLISKGLWSGPSTTFTMNLDVCGKKYSASSAKDGTVASPADIPTP